MALYLLATAVDGQTILNASIWNTEFRQIYQNSLALISPLTGTLNANNNQITNARLENLTATPTAAHAGRLVFVTLAGNKLLVLDDGSALRYVPNFSTAADASGFGSVGSNGQVFTVSGGVPVWSTLVPAMTLTTVNATALFAPSITTTTLAATTIGATTIQAHTSLTVGGGSAVTKVLTATGSCVWPAVNSAATISTTITVTGATSVNTDQVLVSHSAVTAASVMLYGYVSALNTVTVSLYNGTGATYNAGSGTLRATLIKYV